MLQLPAPHAQSGLRREMEWTLRNYRKTDCSIASRDRGRTSFAKGLFTQSKKKQGETLYVIIFLS